MMLEPLFKVRSPIKLKKLSGKRQEQAGYKQVLVDSSDRILIGRNHAYGVPQWFEDIEYYANKLLREGNTAVEVWEEDTRGARGVVVGIKNGKKNKVYPFGRVSEKTLADCKFKKKAGYQAFNK